MVEAQLERAIRGLSEQGRLNTLILKKAYIKLSQSKVLSLMKIIYPLYKALKPSSLTMVFRQCIIPRYLLCMLSDDLPCICRRVLIKSLGNVMSSALHDEMPPMMNGSNVFLDMLVCFESDEFED